MTSQPDKAGRCHGTRYACRSTHLHGCSSLRWGNRSFGGSGHRFAGYSAARAASDHPGYGGLLPTPAQSASVVAPAVQWPVSRDVDHRAQLDQVDHVGDRHGQVHLAELALWSCARRRRRRLDPWRGAPPGARPRAERQAGVPGRSGTAVNATGRPRRRRRRALDPVEPNSAGNWLHENALHTGIWIVKRSAWRRRRSEGQDRSSRSAWPCTPGAVSVLR
jgi:hypothetical protein